MAFAAQLEFPDSLVEALAARVVAAVCEQMGSSVGPWLDVTDAALYLCTSPDALRKAVQRGQVPAHQPLGPKTRFLFNRAELDDWVVT